jgi:hypothetical protein
LWPIGANDNFKLKSVCSGPNATILKASWITVDGKMVNPHSPSSSIWPTTHNSSHAVQYRSLKATNIQCRYGGIALGGIKLLVVPMARSVTMATFSILIAHMVLDGLSKGLFIFASTFRSHLLEHGNFGLPILLASCHLLSSPWLLAASISGRAQVPAHCRLHLTVTMVVATSIDFRQCSCTQYGWP